MGVTDAPWCGHCKALAPEYAKAAGQLLEEKSDIQLAKVDATEETELAEKNEIKGYPTLKFYRKGKAMEYNDLANCDTCAGGRTAEEIIRWLKKKTGPPAKDINSVDEAKELIDSGEVVIMGYFKNKESDKAKIYLEIAADNDEFPFGITSEDNVLNEHEAKDGHVILYKKFDEGKNKYTEEVTKEALSQFIKANSLPVVVDFNHQSAQKIFGGDIKSHNLLFLSKSNPSYKEYLDTFTKVARDFRGKVLFVTIDTDEEDHERIVEFFGLKKEDIPDLRLIRLQDEMTKYRPSKAGDLSEKAIRDFVNGVLDGSIKPHLLSQDLPEDWDKHPVKVLVSTNFDEVVFDKSKDVLVEFCK
ncbi:Pdi [Cordylochernes scorpioides]|uniref:Pdi n=1 Tax=Cordylochernes scorpioides TaxID=51811 RepID=A0ABY6LBE5_9ARAC|nr:Pdi [Cordylochernes scorpioides]